MCLLVSYLCFFSSALIGSAGSIIVSTVSTVNKKDQMFLLLFAKVFDDSEKKLKKVRPNFRQSKSTVSSTGYGSYLSISQHIPAHSLKGRLID